MALNAATKTRRVYPMDEVFLEESLEEAERAAGPTDEERMRTLIELLSTYVERYHNGAIEMVSYDGQTLKIRLLGACEGCALASGTVHGWVEGNVREFFPNLESVEAV
jgi:Fe-S cluster biogenesis protein NfuA